MLNPKGFSSSLFGQYVIKKRRETSGRQSSHRVPPLPKRGLQSNNAAKSVECCSQQLFLGLRVRYRGGGEENFQRLTRLLRLRESLSVTVAVKGSAIANGGKKEVEIALSGSLRCGRERERKGVFLKLFYPSPPPRSSNHGLSVPKPLSHIARGQSSSFACNHHRDPPPEEFSQGAKSGG